MSIDRATPILVADDQASAVTFIADMLDRMGFSNVEIAADGLAGLDILRQAGSRLIISELEMAPMCGFEMLRNIKADAKLRACPVIMMAARLTPVQATAVKHAGAHGLILKPFTAAALGAKIDAALSGSGGLLAPIKPVAVVKKTASTALGRRFERRWS